MLKTLPKKQKNLTQLKFPKSETLFSILNYSKSLTKSVLNEKKVLINLN